MFIKLRQIVLKKDEPTDISILINSDCLMSATLVEYTRQIPLLDRDDNVMQTTVIKLTGLEPIHVRETVDEIYALLGK